MSTGADELRAKMAQIAGRYIERVTRELVQLQGLVEDATGGNLEVVREIEGLAHRMHGSGAMLQFDEISGCAGELERLAAGCVASGTIDQPRMVEVLGKLQAAIEREIAHRSAS
ncbi:MAG TPA: Hpt domain-containing protein [Steroidobacter sp.]|nr:Hpt domain-containing protein [Steroidobacter sp.]